MLIEHRNVVNLMRWVIEEYGCNENDSGALTSSMCFDASIEMIFGMLITGGVLHILKNEEILNPYEIREYLLRYSITLLSSTPSYFVEMTRALPKGAWTKPFESAMRFVSGGELLREQDSKIILSSFNLDLLYNTYGPTETTVNATSVQVGLACEYGVSIGKPLPNYRIYILDEGDGLCPIG
ncbi:AMP-binding protein, partial [Pelagicoccus sp. SDUM812002]|uniref:AMP-binding protein n=1 Tax=Pelagicoccus sp. SDUM812002 TaxID=3041266 RepID=UPI00280D1563